MNKRYIHFNETSKALYQKVDTCFTVPTDAGGTEPKMDMNQRKPVKNTSFSIHFVIKGAEKRRNLAYGKARMLQTELGVIPHLVSVK